MIFLVSDLHMLTVPHPFSRIFVLSSLRRLSVYASEVHILIVAPPNSRMSCPSVLSEKLYIISTYVPVLPRRIASIGLYG
jgi:hypothetical protein